MPDLAAEAENLAGALETMLEQQGKLLMMYVPAGMSCSLRYQALYRDGNGTPKGLRGGLTIASKSKGQ